MTPEDDPIYCPVCSHCGDTCCCGIEGFLEHHIEGKTGCLYEKEILDDIRVAWRRHALPDIRKYWIDDERPAPDGSYVHLHSVFEMTDELAWLKDSAPKWLKVGVIDLDHDAGEYAHLGGDYIEILNYMEENDLKFPVAFHTMNPVGRANMERIAKKMGLEIKQTEWRGTCD